MPAYNAAQTLEQTCTEVLAQPFVDDVIIVDDCSSDDTGICARQLIDRFGGDRLRYHRIERNRGYGGNQKTCYALALAGGADIVIMVHPDYQYTPLLIPAMASMIGNGLYRCVIGSRILGGGGYRDSDRCGLPCACGRYGRDRDSFEKQEEKVSFAKEKITVAKKVKYER